MEYVITHEKREAIIAVLGKMPAEKSFNAIAALLALPPFVKTPESQQPSDDKKNSEEKPKDAK